MHERKALTLESVSFPCTYCSVAYFWADALMDSLFAYRSPAGAGSAVAGQSVGSPLTRRVVLVLVDALRKIPP
jgi:hypothetical protein